MSRQDDTPLMQQWREAKSRHPDAIVFFRVGDFYEMFCEDAEEGARLLGLTLTSRNNGGAANVPLAGVPVRARDEYLQRLVRLGRRVAVCEQMEDPSEARGIVRREVVETVTPGALLTDALLARDRNNFLVCLADAANDALGMAAVDISTGEVIASLVDGASLLDELARLEPAELLLPASWHGRAPAGHAARATFRPDWLFTLETAAEEVTRRYRVHSLEGFDVHAADAPLVRALGALIAYVAEVQPGALESLRPPRIERAAHAMLLDEMTRRNLELVEPLRSDATRAGGRNGTLLEVVDETRTAMGARALRRWLLRPLLDAGRIWARQEAVAELYEDVAMRRALRNALREMRDLGRLAGKAAGGRMQPRELLALRDSLACIPLIAETLGAARAPLLLELRESLDPLDDVRDRIARGLADDPPAAIGDGGVIRAGYDSELDELRETRDGAQDLLARMQARERERTGIGSLKVGYNKVFGYYLEITRANLERVPADYERRQTLANAERFVTPELKQWESRILQAEERILELENRLFTELRHDVGSHTARIQRTADAIAAVDVIAAFARLAERRSYTRPDVHSGFRLEIRAGRHPVVETMMPREDFIPNDIVLDEDARIMILTGPNMAGKSTLLRQVGLIQLLAQIGAFVPAGRAVLPICDRIFTRVGASDNLVRGQSTFMVEMQETAAILHGATRSSLVLLDEIGRGTATYDGVSIAWAVTEHLHEKTGSKTIFATHYHELTQLADLLAGIVNTNVAVREVGHDIVFLHHLQAGGADRSYGIEVGRLAGLPPDVVRRAREILRELEGAKAAGGAGLGRAGRHRPSGATAPDQLSLFQAREAALAQRLLEIDVDSLTPLRALNLLAELRDQARRSDPGG